MEGNKSVRNRPLSAAKRRWGTNKRPIKIPGAARFALGCALAFAAMHAATQAATITVNSAADSGGTCPGASCTLRQAIATAAAGDTIDFAAGLTTITLTSAELLIDKELTITGPGASVLTVQRSNAGGTPQFRIFRLIDGGAGFTSIAISGLTISNGNAGSGSPGGVAGGGIFNVALGTVTITGCTISGNFAGDVNGGNGGGIFSAGTMNISNSTISGNSLSDSTASSGGGLANSVGRTVNLTNSTISGNSAHSAAGIFNTGTVNLTNSTVSGNTASAGAGSQSGSVAGGIYNASFRTVNLTNSTVSGNTVSDSSGIGAFGGGIYTDGTVSLTNSTISGNSTGSTGSSSFGGGIYNGFGTVNGKNTIIAKNMAPGGGPDFYGPLISQGYNLIGDNSNATITPMTGDQIGTSASPIDPLLGPLQDNGGPTFTRALLTGSPAIDKGAAATNPVTGSAITTDQRGFTRPVDDPAITNATGGNGSDIGAFELCGAAPRKLVNISSRASVGTGDNVAIGGFIIHSDPPGTTRQTNGPGVPTKRVLIRGIGPSLQAGGNPLNGRLMDPVLDLYDSQGVKIDHNDNWMEEPDGVNNPARTAAIQATGLAPSNPNEAALLEILNADSAHTAILSGKNNTTGIGLVEVYDLEATSNTHLANLSGRAFVSTGDDVLIGGLIVQGCTPARILLRAIGPSLSGTGISNPLPDPVLELHDSNGAVITINDDWMSDDAANISATGLAPSDPKESAILFTPAPGAYTAIVLGKDPIPTGVGLVEAYNLGP